MLMTSSKHNNKLLETKRRTARFIIIFHLRAENNTTSALFKYKTEMISFESLHIVGLCQLEIDLITKTTSNTCLRKQITKFGQLLVQRITTF